MAKQYTEHLELIRNDTDDTVPFKPDYQGNLDKLDQHAALVDGALADLDPDTGAISQEAAARIQGDGVNAQAIATEATTRASAVTAVQGNINAEVTARTASGTAATTALNNEITARQAGDAANATSVTNEVTARQAAISALQTALTSTSNDLIAEVATRVAQYNATNAALALKADLINGKVDATQLPTTALSGNIFPVNSQASMLALSAQPGDIAKRTDQSNTLYLLQQLPASTLGNWSALTGDYALSADLQTEISNRAQGDTDTLNAAKADATTKASNAQTAAINAAATDATSKAAAAQTASAQKTANLSDLSDSAAARSNLGLGSAAVQPSSAFDSAGAAATVQSVSLQKAANLSDVADVPTARSNLGLGSSATQPSSAFDAAGAAATAQTAATNAAATDATNKTAAAQAASLQKSSNLSDVADVPTARTNLGLGTAAVQPASAFDSAGAAAAAQTSAISAAASDATSRVATETSRATAAEATKVDKASGSTAFKIFNGAFADAPNDSYVLDPYVDGGLPVDVVGGFASYNKVGAGSDPWLIGRALAGAFRPTSSPPTYDSTYGTLTGSNIAWEDGTTGVYTVPSLDANGAELSFTATYIGSTTKTVTVTFPRNSDSQINAPVTAVVS